MKNTTGHPTVRPHPPENARAAYASKGRPFLLTTESIALEAIKSAQKHPSRNPNLGECLIVDIDDFEIYRSPGNAKPFELAALHNFDVKAKKLSISGTISHSQAKYYIENAEIENYCVEGYGSRDDYATTIYVMSQTGAKDKDFTIWYRLQTPHPSYRPFHTAFKWISQFGKHVVDFLDCKHHVDVGLRKFKRKFFAWTYKRWKDDTEFEKWHREFGKSDFRVAFHAYVDYLYAQACNLPDIERLLAHPCWRECLRGDEPLIPEQPQRTGYTIATPYVYNCFKGMYFARCLKEVDLQGNLRKENSRRKRALGFPLACDPSPTQHPPSLPIRSTRPVGDATCSVGDVVGVKTDSDGPWKTGDDDWLAYITRVEPYAKGLQRLYVIWMYRPADTTISSVYYPNAKEIFISDHCNCRSSPLLSTDVVRHVSVEWKPKQMRTQKDYFVQTKYVAHDNSFVTMRDSDVRCTCGAGVTENRVPGETFYLKRGQKAEPVVFISHNKDSPNKVDIRLLGRLAHVDANLRCTRDLRTWTPANELVWTDELCTVPLSRIGRKCHVRYVPLDEVVPAPYNQGGIGDNWYFTYGITNGNLKELSGPPTGFIEGPLLTPVRPLKGLSIFSGGGNLDRGLEEGGAVNFTHVIDISAEAIHTQRANAQHPSKTNFYWGSVDDYQLALCEGFEHEVVARIGDIQFIAAGSPCPGFSALQLDWKSEQSLRNASHITTLCSMLDVYRPEYALLENVVSMANTRNGHEEEKVFSQLIACIVGMGYQVSQFLMDSWTQGSAQRRSRIFLAIAAPGLRPISQPPQMFNHPDDIKGRSLGRLVNGLNFGSRDFEPAPFNYNTASAATADLPRIGSGMSQVCIPFPDHRVVYTMKESDRALMKRIPVYPPGQGYVEALKAGLLPPSVQKNKKEYGKAFRRIKAAGQFPTITTNVNAQDNRCGNVLHWADPRTMSIQEARRAQGFPDSEVIVGSLAEQWRIIGNAVDRHVSRALGWSLRMAVGMNDQRGDSAACDTQKTTERISSDWVPASDDELAMERITIKTTIERVRFAPRSPKPALHKRASTPKAHDLGQELSQAGESVSTTAVPRSVGKRKVPQALESVNSTTKRKVAQAPEQISNTSHVSGSTEKQRRKRVKTETDDFAESNSSQSHKRTRYSGHQLEFTPTRWSKIPEKEVRKVGKTESEQ